MKFIIYILLLAITNHVYAEVERDDRIWLTYQADHQLSSNLKAMIQIQPYWRYEGVHRDQITIRPGLYYQFSNTVYIGGGYAYNLGFNNSNQHTHEQRLWEDISATLLDSNSYKVQERTRFEHRQFEHQGEISTGLRQLIKLSFQLSTDYTAIITDEAYFNLNNTAQVKSGFDQNRLFLGVGRKILTTTNLEVGYLNQYVAISTPDRMNHVIAININQSF
ncbi:DUF2490 domain-containing protein [Methylotenera sp.]|uniref:DUF2490 domain-containing protein n=1 Tax=Methylotenera sp. TaxID=2051956 RepID=UPI002ED81F36